MNASRLRRRSSTPTRAYPADLAGEAVDESGKNTELPTWFGPESAPMFGVVHVPSGGHARAGIVICPPLGKEHVDTYRGLKLLAQSLCARGFAVLRFDYTGTGDSSVVQGTDTAVEDYRASIQEAVAFLRKSGANRIGLVGLRAGALLAAATAPSICGVTELVLWDPVADGRLFLREQRILYKMSVGADVVDAERESILGISLSQGAARALKALAMPTEIDTATSVLILAREERSDDAKLAALRANSNSQLIHAVGQAEFVEPADFVVEIPVDSIDAITSWLDTRVPMSEHSISPAICREAAVATLPDGRRVIETIDELGPNRLFAIRTWVSGVDADGPTLIIHNTAAQHRVGPGRVWVEAARELAAEGMIVVRFDRRGTGETGLATTEFVDMYSDTSKEDVRDIVSAIGVTPDRLMMTGVCSGAWSAAYGAYCAGAKSVVLVNAVVYSFRHVEFRLEKLLKLTPPEPGDSAERRPRTWVDLAKKWTRRWLPHAIWLQLGNFGVTQVPELLLKQLKKKTVSVDIVLSPDDHAWFDKQRGTRAISRVGSQGWTPRLAVAPTGDHSLMQRDIQVFTRRYLATVAAREFGVAATEDADRQRRADESADGPPSTLDSSAEHIGQRHAAAKNTAALLLSRLAVSAMGWAGTVLIARLLSPTDWGIFAFVFGLLGMMAIITDLGVGRVVLARLLEGDLDEADVVATSFVTLRAVLGIFGYVLAIGYVVVMGYSAHVIWVTALAGVVVIIATPSHALSVLYQSRLKLVTVAMAEASAQMFQLILTIIAAVTMPVLLIFVLPAIANEIFSGTWKLIGIRRGWIGPRLNARPRLRLWREMLIEAIPLSIGLGMVTLLSKVDILMLGKLDSFESVGLYTIAYKFAEMVANGVLAIVTPVATLLVAAWPHFNDEFRRRVRSAAVAVALLTSIAVVGLWGSAEPVIELLYGERFTQAADATRMLLLGAVFAELTHLMLIALISVGQQRIYPWVAFGALALNIGLNVVLIPRYSFNGSAFATVLTELAMFLAMWALMARTIAIRGLMPVGKLTILAVLTAVICGAQTAAVELTRLPWGLLCVGAVALFVVAAHLLRLQDMRMLRNIIGART